MGSLARAKRTLLRMQDLITYEASYVRDDLFIDPFVCATRSHTNIIQRRPQPHRRDGVCIWLDGEFCNRQELASRCEAATDDDLEILHTLFRGSRDFSFLRTIDGFFSAVVYDTNTGKLHLITDRYGLRRLYWTVHRGLLWWSSELKPALALPGFEPRIDRRAIQEFLSIGCLLEDRTWFEGVELLPSATVLTWDTRDGGFCTVRYWWWDQIRPCTGRIDELEVAEELGRLFVDAVERRCPRGKRVGLTLSGGLDSRAILAAMPDHGYPVHAVTFGRPGCDDIRIAAAAAKLKGAAHHVVEIGPGNWLTPRITGVWWTDGEQDLMHMHAMAARDVIRAAFDINLNGFAGDLILGGSHLLAGPRCEHPKQQVAAFMGCEPGLIESFEAYSHLRTLDFFFLQNRVRRFTYCGTRNLLTSTEQRKPFYDTRLVDFVYSLPDRVRMHGRIYKRMLLSAFPEYYRHIPWQRVGACIGAPRPVVKALHALERARRLAFPLGRRLGVPITPPHPRGMVNYPAWIRAEPAHSFFDSVLNDPDALYRAYLPSERVRDAWEKHLGGEDFSSFLCRHLTFEIWLHQVFTGKFRPPGV